MNPRCIISGNGDGDLDENDPIPDLVCDRLREAWDNNFFAQYEQIVDQYTAVLNEFCFDFWGDIFLEVFVEKFFFELIIQDGD
jgi:hypothetical protein